MSERLKPSLGYEPPNISVLLEQNQTGNSAALNNLFGHLKERFKRYFFRRLPYEADDLTQDTLMRVFERLDRFDPTLGRGTPEQNFLAWSYRLARGTLADYFKSKALEEKHILFREDMDEIAEPETSNPFPRQESYPLNLDDTLLAFHDWLSTFLSPLEKEAAVLRLKGTTDNKATSILGVSLDAFRGRVKRARRKIDDEIMQPAGFKKLSDYEESTDSTYRVAATRGSLPAAKLMGKWYTRDEWIKQYRPQRRVTSSSLLDKGYVLVSENTTPDEYFSLTGGAYSHLVENHRGRLYIKKELLTSFRQSREETRRRIPSPERPYKPLVEFADTPAEYDRLYRSARSGKLSAIQVENRWWFTTEEAVEDFFS